jgi:hypothetical protein
VSGSGGQADDLLKRLLVGPVCFDATVPLYLSELGQSAALAGAFRDRGHMPGGVYRELDGLSHYGFPAAATLLRPRPFARVVELSADELDEVLERQRRWNGDRVFNDPSEDRGEAECLQLCRRYEDRSLALCAHDHKARNDPDSRGITKINAIHVCLVFALRGVTSSDVWKIYLGLLRRGMNQVQGFPPDPRGEKLFIQVVTGAHRRLASAGGRP